MANRHTGNTQPVISREEHARISNTDGKKVFVIDNADAQVTDFGGNYKDPMLEISRGSLTGVAHVNKFGRSTAITTTNTWEVWDGNAAYVYPTTAVITKLSQTADQAGMQGENVEVQGLDASWNLSTETIALNGSNTTTAVTLMTPLIRCFRMKVLADVVTTSPIRAHNDAENQDYAIINTGNNQTLMAIYTVPNAKTAYVTNYYGTANPGGGAPTTFNVSLWGADRDNTYEKQLKHIQGVSANVGAYGRMQHFFKPYYKFTQKTDIFLTGSPTGASVDVSAGFDLILVDD
jgi:hypothetical protein